MVRRDTKTAIIDAAVTILGRDGPDGFSAAALAREVGVSKATLFHHFSTLDAIPIAAFERMIAQSLDREISEHASLSETLSAFGADTFALVENRRDFLNAYFVFMAKGLFDERLGAEFRRSGDVLLEHMRAALAPKLAADADVAAHARLAAMVLDGLAIHLIAFDSGPDVAAAWNLFLKRLESKERDT